MPLQQSSVLDYDGVNGTDISEALQRSLNKEGIARIPDGTFRVRGVELTSDDMIVGPNAKLINNFKDGTPMFYMGKSINLPNGTLSKSRDNRYLEGKIKLRSILSTKGSGHVFESRNGVSQCKFLIDKVIQDEVTKSIMSSDDKPFNFNTIDGMKWGITDEHKESAIDLYAVTSKHVISGNTFNITIPDRSGEKHYLSLINDHKRNYSKGNRINFPAPEVTNGGLIKLVGMANTGISLIQFYDLKTVVNNMIQVGEKGRRRNISTTIRDYMRNAGKMGGNHDINIVNSIDTIVDGAHGINKGTPCIVSCDLGELTINNGNKHLEIIGL